MSASADYIGRFAPSPTGDLHFGSLLAALASYCDAKQANGIWQLRIDDIDPPREISGAAERIQTTLKQYGFSWDGPTLYQSQRLDYYAQKLHELNSAKLLYPCTCSRKQLAGSTIYPGNCAHVLAEPEHSASTTTQVATKIKHTDADVALRLKVKSDIRFKDAIQNQQAFNVNVDIGDTIVLRRDGLFAYALCCAIDDAEQSTHVIRGADLLSTTGAQLQVIRSLGLNAPNYANIPVAINTQGQKLSKQTLAQAIQTMDTLATLKAAWHFLGQSNLDVNSVKDFWHLAISSWNLASVPKCSQVLTEID